MTASTKKYLLILVLFFSWAPTCSANPYADSEYTQERLVTVEFQSPWKTDVICMAYLVSESYLATSKSCAKMILNKSSTRYLAFKRHSGNELAITLLEKTPGNNEDIAYLHIKSENKKPIVFTHKRPETPDNNPAGYALWYPETLDSKITDTTIFKATAVSLQPTDTGGHAHLSTPVPDAISGSPVTYNGELVCIYSAASGLCATYDHRHGSRQKRALADCKPFRNKTLIACDKNQTCQNYCPQKGCFNDGADFDWPSLGSTDCYRRIVTCPAKKTYCEYNEQGSRCEKKADCDYLQKICKTDCSEYECHIHRAHPGKTNTWGEPRPCFGDEEKEWTLGVTIGIPTGTLVLVAGIVGFSWWYNR